MVSSTSKGNAPNAGKCTVITLKCTFHCRGCCRGIRPESVVESWGRLALGSCPMCFFWPKLPSPANFPGNIRRGGRGGRGDRREIGGGRGGAEEARRKAEGAVIGAEGGGFAAGQLQSLPWCIVEGRAVKKATELFRAQKIIFPVS